MNVLNICGITVLSVIVVIFLKQLKSSIALPLTMIFGIVLLRQAVSLISNEIGFFTDFTKEIYFADSSKMILKVFGISLIIETTSDICKDAGENSLASKIELVGKAEIFVLSLPLIKKALELIKNIML